MTELIKAVPLSDYEQTDKYQECPDDLKAIAKDIVLEKSSLARVNLEAYYRIGEKVAQACATSSLGDGAVAKLAIATGMCRTVLYRAKVFYRAFPNGIQELLEHGVSWSTAGQICSARPEERPALLEAAFSGKGALQLRRIRGPHGLGGLSYVDGENLVKAGIAKLMVGKSRLEITFPDLVKALGCSEILDGNFGAKAGFGRFVWDVVKREFPDLKVSTKDMRIGGRGFRPTRIFTLEGTVAAVPATPAVPTIEDDLDKRRLKDEARKWRRSYEDALKRIDQMRVQQDVIDGLPPVQKPEPILPSQGGSGDEAVAVFVTSDWHIEEDVDGKTIEYRNEYNPEIAGKRLEKMWKSALKVIDKERSLSRIDRLIVAVLGDLITGYIHEELVEGNHMSPTQALELAQGHLVRGLTFLADHGKFEKISVPCCVGNHGRTTEQRRVATSNTNSFEWYMYRQVAAFFKNDPRFEFIVADGYHITWPVLGYNIRFHHGENVRFNGGVGGLTIPFNKAVQAWNKNNPEPAAFDVMGHYHQLHFLPDGVVNGSVIGYNAYAQSIKARMEEPQQALFLVAKDHGPTCFNRIWVQ